MLNYHVDISQDVRAFLEKLDVHLRERIKKRLMRLAENSFPADSKFILRDQGEKIHRFRIGAYRALYKVRESESVVLVFFLEKRENIYD